MEQLHEQIIDVLKTNQKARDKINQVEHGEVVFQVQDGRAIRWKAGTAGNIEQNKKKRD